MLLLVRTYPALLMPVLLLLGCPIEEPDPEPAELAAFDPDAAERLDAALDDLVQEFGVPGIQAAVSLPGVEPWLGWSGVSGLEVGAPLASGHEQPAGSVTKTLTSALTLDLVDEGLLSLDDLVSTWLPDFPWAAPVTVRHLLQHSSGIPEHFTALELDGTLGEVWTLDALVDVVAAEDLLFEPGSDWAYSNTNYVLLGLLAEAATGQGWEARATELLARADSGARVPTDGWGDVIPGYLLLGPDEPYELFGETDMSNAVHPSSIGPAGNLVAEAGDLARWAAAFWGGDGIVPEALVEEAVAEPMEVSASMEYGLGVMLRQDDHGVQWFHNGALYGYVAWMGWRPEHGASLALLCNGWVRDEGGQITPYWSTDAADDLWDALYAE
jgi:D-alanyl-D-alanine carboxypeptidase